MNLLRACEASIDLAMYIVRLKHLGLPRRDAFVLLEQAGFLAPALSRQMQAMVGFRNVAVRDYRALSLEMLRSILEHHLEDFRRSAIIFERYSRG